MALMLAAWSNPLYYKAMANYLHSSKDKNDFTDMYIIRKAQIRSKTTKRKTQLNQRCLYSVLELGLGASGNLTGDQHILLAQNQR